ncbi:MAG: hypothetical protein ACRD1S_00215 [Vicinamibacterales bacterium]
MRTIVAALTVAIMAASAAPDRVALVAGEGLREPFGVDFDRAGNTYIVEMEGNRVSVIDREGRQRVLAGTGEAGLSGDGGPAIRAQFRGPHHLLIGPDGDLYVADTFNNCVRRINLRTGVIARVAGTGEKGFSGDGGAAVSAAFGGIYAIGFQHISDSGNHRVLRLTPR